MAGSRPLVHYLIRSFSSRTIAHQIKRPNVSQSSFLKRCIPSTSIVPLRTITEKQFAEEEAKQHSWTQWFFDPFMKSINPTEKIATQGELDAREELLARVQACYYKKPPTEPGKEFFEEAAHLLIQYDDWRSLEALWRLGEVNGHQFDDELINKVEDYLLEVRQRRWYED